MLRRLLILLFLLPIAVKAKEYPMLHYTIEDGLPSNMIYAVYDDPDGFLWIGTDKGVARYNGEKFEIFTTADGLADNECFSFQADYEGRLWIATFNGMLCYYKDGKFHNAQNTPFLKLPIKAANTSQIFLNKDSSLSILFRDEAGIVEVKGEKIKIIRSAFMVEQFRRVKLLQTGTLHRAVKINNDDYELYYGETYAIHSGNKTSSRRHYQNIIFHHAYSPEGKSNDSAYFLVYKKGIFSLKDNKFIYTDTQFIRRHFIMHVLQNGPDLFLGTQEGLFINNEPLLSGQAVNRICRDRRGDFWITTAHNGLYKLSGDYRYSEQFSNPAISGVVFAWSLPPYLLFCNDTRDLFRVDRKTKKVDLLFDYAKSGAPYGEVNSSHWVNKGVYYNFSNYVALKISGVGEDKVRVARFKIDTGAFWHVRKAIVASTYTYFKCMGGMSYVLSEQFENSVTTINDKRIFINSRIFEATQSGRDEVWFSTLNSVYSIKDTVLSEQKQFQNTGFRDFLIRDRFLLGITQQNELLICSNYRDLNLQTDTVKSNDCIWDKLYAINDSTFLISTNNYYRLLSIYTEGKTVRFSVRLVENRFVPYQPDFLYIDTAASYFFKKGTLISLSNQFILKNRALPEVRFLTLETGKEVYPIRSQVRLDYFNARNINIHFTALSFEHKNLSYEYSIGSNNIHENWVAINGQELNLFKLGFGDFIIKIRAKTMSGEYTQAAAFKLSVDKPYWATWWFLGMALLVFILLIAYAARLGIRRSLRKKENEVRFLRSEYRALNALMNPHFIFNSLNSVQSLVNNNENETASKYIRIFSDLIRQNMRNISNELISLSKEMDLVEHYLRIEQLRFKQKLNYHIDIKEEVEADLIMVPPLLIQPLVENAIKHGVWPKKSNDGFISISIYEEKDLLFIEIKDNGAGIAPMGNSDTLHESYAMTNIHKRIEQLSRIHQTKITVSIKEIIGADAAVKGVQSLVTIDLSGGAMKNEL